MALLQWNINRVGTHYSELSRLSKLYNPITICLQETNLDESSLFNLKGYTIYRNDYTLGQKACNGVAILVHDSVAHTLVPITSPLQVVTVQINLLITILQFNKSYNFTPFDLKKEEMKYFPGNQDNLFWL